MKVEPALLFVSVCSSENANKIMDLIREHDHVGIRTVHIMKSEDMESELLVFPNLFDKTFRDKMIKLRKENICVINSVPITKPSFFRRSYRINAGEIETVTRLLGPLSDKILQAFIEFLMLQYTAG